MIRFLIALSALLAAPAGAETIAIVNAHLLTVSPLGEVQSGTLVVKDGRISAVGAGVTPPKGARIVDAKGGIVTPGLIAVDTSVTISELSGVSSTDDSATASDSLSAAYDVQYAVNSNSSLIAEARRTGLTRAVVTPNYPSGDHGERLFAGLGAIVQLGEGAPVTRNEAVLVVELGEAGAHRSGGGRPSTVIALRQALVAAREHARDRGRRSAGEALPSGLSPADLRALVPVAEGRTPLLARVHRAADIRQLLSLAKEEGVRLILQGAEEAWMMASQIAAAGVPVILDPQANLPTNFEILGARLDNAARLHAAGVQVIIQGSRDIAMLRQARFNAGIAVSYGLSYDDALAAITLNPARIFGVEADLGSLAAGKEADFVIWDGDPLEVTSAPVAVYVRGVEQSLRSRSVELRDRYLRKGDYPPAYRGN